MSTIKTTEKVILVNKPKKAKRKKNKSRSNSQQKGSSSKIGQQQMHLAPVSISVQKKTDNGFGKFRYRRREYLGTITGSAQGSYFDVKYNQLMNPGNPNFSPWSTPMAANFESYRYLRMSIQYVPRIGTNTEGYVAISADMNPNDPVPENDIVAFQNEKTKTCSAWDHMEVQLSKEMISKRKTFFCRKNNVANGPIELYDTGRLFIFTGGQTDASPRLIGQLFIEYEIEFMTPEGHNTQQETAITNATAGLSQTNPINGSNLTIEQTGDFIKEIINANNRGEIYFAKPFHGFVNTFHQGTGLGANNWTALNGGSINETEAGFQSSTITNSGTTVTQGQNLVTMSPGQGIAVGLNAATTLTKSVVTLANCYL
jgi:hypothetical protein